MLTFNGAAIRAERRQLQWMVENLRDLGELKASKACVVRVAKTWGQDKSLGLTEQLLIGPAVNLSKALINFNNYSLSICPDKRQIVVLSELSYGFLCQCSKNLTPTSSTNEFQRNCEPITQKHLNWPQMDE